MDTEWLEDPICVRMMGEDWFEYAWAGEVCVYDNIIVDEAIYVGPTHQARIPLPIHAAWVLARAEEEMREKVEIDELGSNESGHIWGVWDEDEQEWMRDADGDVIEYPSRADAVLAAYEHLYPEKVAEEPDCPDAGRADAPDEQRIFKLEKTVEALEGRIAAVGQNLDKHLHPQRQDGE